MMESLNPTTTHASHTPIPSSSVPIQASMAAVSLTQEDEEYEYEYSATETESYYVTADLTTSNAPSLRRGSIRKRTRTGYRTKWIIPQINKKLKRKPRKSLSPEKRVGTGSAHYTPPDTPNIEGDEEEPHDGSGDDEEQDDEEQELEGPDGVEKAASRGAADPKSMFSDDALSPAGLVDPSDEESPIPTREFEKIQILDLHSDNPIISYKNLTFSCNWAENIGTEMLFTNHDSNNPIPSLRSLPGNVDLIAASSARLISTPVTLVPKDRPREDRPRGEVLLRRASLVVPVGSGAGPARKKQGSFLERMQDLKVRKNEEDEVTILALKRHTNKDWYHEVKSNWDGERAELQKLVTKGKMSTKDADAKLEEISRMEKELDEQPAAWKTASTKRKRAAFDDGNPGAGKRTTAATRAKRGLRGKSRRVRGTRGRGSRTTLKVSESPEPGDSQSMLSTPTPQTWDDLGRRMPVNARGEDTQMSG